jgi:UDP:flavonoid glycosyltransferase YjiC (YdhE family)
MGRPTVVVPFFGDQWFWGDTVARRGAGPKPIPFKQLTLDRLSEAIELHYDLSAEKLRKKSQTA